MSFSSCGSQALEHGLRKVGHGFSCSVASESSHTSDWFPYPCIASRILIHCTRSGSPAPVLLILASDIASIDLQIVDTMVCFYTLMLILLFYMKLYEPGHWLSIFLPVQALQAASGLLSIMSQK